MILGPEKPGLPKDKDPNSFQLLQSELGSNSNLTRAREESRTIYSYQFITVCKQECQACSPKWKPIWMYPDSWCLGMGNSFRWQVWTQTLAGVRPVLVRNQKTSGLQRFHKPKVLSRSLTQDGRLGKGERRSTRGLKLCVPGLVWSPSLTLCHTHKQWEYYQGFLFRQKTSQHACPQNPYLKAGDSLEETSSTTGLLVKN